MFTNLNRYARQQTDDSAAADVGGETSCMIIY